MGLRSFVVRSLARSIVAWHHSQADVRAGNGAVIQRHDANVNDVQRFGTVVKIFETQGRTHRAAGSQRSRTYEKLRRRAARKALASQKISDTIGTPGNGADWKL